MKQIHVLGIDAAFANMGFARMTFDMSTGALGLIHIRTVSTEKLAGKKKVIRQNSDDLRRGRELHQALHAELDGVTVAFAEIPSGAQAARASMGFGIAIGVLASVSKPLFEVMPAETKEASVGSKTAEKHEIIAWAAGLYPDAAWQRYERPTAGKKPKKAGDLHDDNEHAADAIAVVHAGIQTTQFQGLISMLKSMSAT